MTFSSLILRKNCREVKDIEADNWNKGKLKLDEAHINIWRFHLLVFRISYLAAKQNTRQNITLRVLQSFWGSYLACGKIGLPPPPLDC